MFCSAEAKKDKLFSGELFGQTKALQIREKYDLKSVLEDVIFILKYKMNENK